MYIARTVRIFGYARTGTNNGTCTSQKTRQVVGKHSYEAEKRKTKKHTRKQRERKQGKAKKEGMTRRLASLNANTRGTEKNMQRMPLS